MTELSAKVKFLIKHKRRNMRSLILILGLVLGAVGICLFIGALLMGFSIVAIPVGFTGTFLIFFGPWGARQYYKNQRAEEYAAKHAAIAEKEGAESATRERDAKETELKKAADYVSIHDSCRRR